MSIQSRKLNWRESKNNVSIDCDLEVRIHPTKSKTILLLVPGVDGSVDGYENKYVTIAESIQRKHNVAVVRIENPFITSYHWESNVRQILKYIEENSTDICGSKDYELRIQAHSAGASVVALIAHEYVNIQSLLLINIAMSLHTQNIIEGIKKYNGDVTILMGDKDASLEEAKKIGFSENSNTAQVVTAKETDHDFSGDSFKQFLEAADQYLFGDSK